MHNFRDMLKFSSVLLCLCNNIGTQFDAQTEMFLFVIVGKIFEVKRLALCVITMPQRLHHLLACSGKLSPVQRGYCLAG